MFTPSGLGLGTYSPNWARVGPGLTDILNFAIHKIRSQNIQLCLKERIIVQNHPYQTLLSLTTSDGSLKILTALMLLKNHNNQSDKKNLK